MTSRSQDAVATHGIRTTAIASGAAALGTLPGFLTGTLANFMRTDFAFSQAELGMAIAAFFAASALTALPGGQLTERIGARISLAGSVAVTAAASLGIGLLARSYGSLIVLLVVAGCANGVMQPAANLALARGVPAGRLGTAFGVKQSALPAATLLAGAAVPLVALTVGWKWAFLGVSALAVVVTASTSRLARHTTTRRSASSRPDLDTPRLQMVILATTAGFAAAIATALASFYVESGVDAGVAPGTAGGLLVLGSASVIAVRLSIGWSADRVSRDHLRTVSVMLAIGAVGLFGLGYSTITVVLLGATMIAFSLGWGWPGLFNFAIVQLNPRAPAKATAITQTGVFVGGILGPAVFGTIVEHASFRAAWTMCAVVYVVIAASLGATRRSLARHAGASTTRPSTATPDHESQQEDTS